MTHEGFRRIVVMGAACAALLLGATATYAWNEPLCWKGEVIQPSSFATEALYDKFLKDHPGAFILGPGDTCKKPHHPKPTPSPSPTPPAGTTPTITSTPSPVATPSSVPTPAVTTATPAPVPSTATSSPDQVCVWDNGRWEIRPTTNGKTMTEQGARWPIRPDVCDQHPIDILILLITTPIPLPPTSAPIPPPPAPPPAPAPDAPPPAPEPAPPVMADEPPAIEVAPDKPPVAETPAEPVAPEMPIVAPEAPEPEYVPEHVDAPVQIPRGR